MQERLNEVSPAAPEDVGHDPSIRGGQQNCARVNHAPAPIGIVFATDNREAPVAASAYLPHARTPAHAEARPNFRLLLGRQCERYCARPWIARRIAPGPARRCSRRCLPPRAGRGAKVHNSAGRSGRGPADSPAPWGRSRKSRRFGTAGLRMTPYPVCANTMAWGSLPAILQSGDSAMANNSPGERAPAEHGVVEEWNLAVRMEHRLARIPPWTESSARAAQSTRAFFPCLDTRAGFRRGPRESARGTWVSARSVRRPREFARAVAARAAASPFDHHRALAGVSSHAPANSSALMFFRK